MKASPDGMATPRMGWDAARLWSGQEDRRTKKRPPETTKFRGALLAPVHRAREPWLAREYSGSLKFDPFDDRSDLNHSHLEGIGQTLDRRPTRRLRARLDTRYPGQVIARAFRQLLLGQLPLLPQLTDGATNGDLRRRGVWHRGKANAP